MAALGIFLYTSLKSLTRLAGEEDYFRFFILLGALTGMFSILLHSLRRFQPADTLERTLFLVSHRALGGRRERRGDRPAATPPAAERSRKQ